MMDWQNVLFLPPATPDSSGMSIFQCITCLPYCWLMVNILLILFLILFFFFFSTLVRRKTTCAFRARPPVRGSAWLPKDSETGTAFWRTSPIRWHDQRPSGISSYIYTRRAIIIVFLCCSSAWVDVQPPNRALNCVLIIRKSHSGESLFHIFIYNVCTAYWERMERGLAFIW